MGSLFPIIDLGNLGMEFTGLNLSCSSAADSSETLNLNSDYYQTQLMLLL